MKYLTRFACLVAVIAMPLLMFAPLPAMAADPQDENSSRSLCIGSGGTWDSTTSTCSKAGGQSFPQALSSITNLLLFVIGAIAVIMIIVGGIRYILSNGEQQAVTAAKNTILYAVIGLILSVVAYAIVAFVTGAIKA